MATCSEVSYCSPLLLSAWTIKYQSFKRNVAYSVLNAQDHQAINTKTHRTQHALSDELNPLKGTESQVQAPRTEEQWGSARGAVLSSSAGNEAGYEYRLPTIESDLVGQRTATWLEYQSLTDTVGLHIESGTWRNGIHGEMEGWVWPSQTQTKEYPLQKVGGTTLLEAPLL